MSLINVRRDVRDDFYRYKMERIVEKVEGTGNGIKTVVSNIKNVADALGRPAEYIMKYFGIELGATVQLNPEGRWIINGDHGNKLQNQLDGFINKLVLCAHCKNPETRVTIKEKVDREAHGKSSSSGRDTICLVCTACGKDTWVYPNSRMESFLFKDLEQPNAKKGKKDKAARQAARRAKQQQQANGGAHAKSGDQDNGVEPDAAKNGRATADDGSENGSGSGEKAGKAAGSDDEFEKVQEQLREVVPKASEPKEHEWAVDMSEEAVKARMAQLPGEFQAQVSFKEDEDKDGEGGGSSIYQQFGAWIETEANEKGGVDKVDSFEIYKKAKELGIEKEHRSVEVLVQAIFDDKIITQIPKRARLIKEFMPAGSERHMKAVLGGTERLIGFNGKNDPVWYKRVPKILQLYDDADIIDEEVATKWATTASKKYVDLATSRKVRKAAQPYLDWLKEAEEDDDDDDEEESE